MWQGPVDLWLMLCCRLANTDDHFNTVRKGQKVIDFLGEKFAAPPKIVESFRTSPTQATSKLSPTLRHPPKTWLHTHNRSRTWRLSSNSLETELSSSAARRSLVPTFEIRMVCHVPRPSLTPPSESPLFQEQKLIANLIYPVLATQAIANVIKSSFGPSGLDKMMVDDIGVSS